MAERQSSLEKDCDDHQKLRDKWKNAFKVVKDRGFGLFPSISSPEPGPDPPTTSRRTKVGYLFMARLTPISTT